MVTSPCINVCKMEAGLCTGCWRSIDEIACWAGASDDEKRQMLAAVLRRRDAAAAGGRNASAAAPPRDP